MHTKKNDTLPVQFSYLVADLVVNVGLLPRMPYASISNNDLRTSALNGCVSPQQQKCLP